MKVIKIDTSDSKNVCAKLIVDNKELELCSAKNLKNPESVLNLIISLCEKEKIKISDIDEIYVNEGPVSYTGLKVGISIANALSFGLNITVNGKRNEILTPKYE